MQLLVKKHETVNKCSAHQSFIIWCKFSLNGLKNHTFCMLNPQADNMYVLVHCVYLYFLSFTVILVMLRHDTTILIWPTFCHFMEHNAYHYQLSTPRIFGHYLVRFSKKVTFLTNTMQSNFTINIPRYHIIVFHLWTFFTTLDKII